jgi:hypothetical protein
MSNYFNTKSYIILLIFINFFTVTAQQVRQIRSTSRQGKKTEESELTTKAQELGITADQLQGILNSSVNNDGGDPQPEAMQERFFTGQAVGDGFGSAVASAGDVNGDGFDDIIIGAANNDAAGSNAGRAYIYFCGSIIDNNADVILTGAAVNDYFGYSISSAGDVNGDGYSDVIVGAYNNDIGGADAGTAYIYFGSPTMDNIVDVTLIGVAANDNFGWAVSKAGDVNGDGYSDVIIGAVANSTGGSAAGQAYIYFGGSTMNNIADVTVTGAAVDDLFGYSVSTAGDVNADGYSDVIVGALYNDAGGSDAGSAYIYFGSPAMNNIADVTLTGVTADDLFGNSVSTAGDVNGDGYTDVVIGAYQNDAGGSNAGRAYIYFGGPAMDNAVDLTLTGAGVNDGFGYSISTAGDVNGDGYSDIVVGTPSNDDGGLNAGRAYVYFGGSLMDNIADVILTGAAVNDVFGYSVSTAGDVNGDGYSDIIVGSPYNDAGGLDAGRVYLYTNSLSGADIPDEFFTGIVAGDNFGWSVSTAGDVNGDGYIDMIVGANGNDVGGSGAGQAYIYFGGSGLDNIADVTLTGVAAGDGFGWSVSTAGDVNGDGYSDVIVGAAYNDAAGNSAGQVYIYFGGSAMNNVADIILTGAAANDRFGYSVSTVGDENGDGYSDVIVGAPFNSAGGASAGRAYIYFGSSTMDNIADVTLTGVAANDNFGISVSIAGDVNGDRFSDAIVGADGNDVGGGNAGQAYIYFGGSAMDNTADVTLTGAAASDIFGASVSTAGDVNADGYSDVIIGAYYNNAGTAYIYFGGLAINNTPDAVLTGAIAGDNFGYSVSVAGDVNKDGYGDVIVGAPSNDAGGVNAGQAYIYFGGSGMDNIADVTLTGVAAGDGFGWSVSTAGDENRDGYSDVIVGAAYNDAGGVDAGRAYLFLSSSPLINPLLTSVKDILLDQGGYVRVKWNRSGYDIPGQNHLEDYILQRSDPPGSEGFVWDYVATIPAIRQVEYSYVSPTPYDSMSNTSGTFYFRVIARGTNPDELWYSNIMYGHSVDNLAPLPPLNFYANILGNDVKLGWKANLEEDFRDYYIYRSDTPLAPYVSEQRESEIESPDAFTLIGTTTDTTFTDTSAVTGKVYYYLQAYDVHDNGSQFSGDSVTVYLSANIKVILEGSYDAGGVMRTTLNLQGIIPLVQPFNTSPWNYTGTETVVSIPANVTDWILVELRSTTTTVVERRAAFIKNDGTLVDLDGVSSIKFPTATAGNYYVVIIQRNHISVMTANPVTISYNPTLYDMRTDLSKAYGINAMKSLGGGYYGAYTADTDGSGTVNAADRSNTWNQRNLSGYYGTDVDLSGTVNAADRSTVWNNRNISTQVPTPVAKPITEIVKENNE